LLVEAPKVEMGVSGETSKMCIIGGAPGTGLGRASASPGTTPLLSVRIYIWQRELGVFISTIRRSLMFVI